MSDEPLPSIEYCPPYSLDFVAHLHGGCYSEDIMAKLLTEVRADQAGQRMLDQLTIIQMELSLVRAHHPKIGY
ncbi:hypothetical protein [Mycobacteroides abscessus]|uniref:hypothetical protein n=1 Tax=Mycobacteroides abscessus TaxID=36809 RepID=UPI00210829B2|nr:hypothetical protein [Mycobacteroides abscessus]